MRKIDTKSIEDIFALTPLQEGMLFHYLREPESDVYFEQLALELSGEIDKTAFEQAWNLIIAGNETLRTVFRWEKMNDPVQVVMKEHRLEPLYYDLPGEGLTREQILRRREEIKTRDRREKFDLRQTPFRVTLCKLAKDHYEMIISHHHILYDGWSNSILLKEFFNTYDELGRGEIPAPVLKTRFKEFVKYTREHSPEDSQKQEEYWKGYLAGLVDHTELSIKTGQTAAAKSHEAANWQIRIPTNIKSKLEALVHHFKITPAVVFYSVWGLLLQGYNDGDDMVFGTTVSGRTPAIKNIENMVGLFINTLPLRFNTQGEIKIEDLLFAIHQDLQQREKFNGTPLVGIKEYCGLNPQHELFDTLMVVENYPLDPAIMHKQKGLTPLSYSMSAMTHYDLTAAVTLGEQIDVIFSYPASLFERDMIERMAGHFTCILEEMAENPGKRLRDIEQLTPEEKRQLLEEFNDTAADFPGDKTIHELFADQVERTPDHIAVIGSTMVETLRATSLQITYRELNENSNRLAGLLIEKGVLADDIIAIMMERSIEMVIGIFGILKASGAYLPIDPDYPGERKQYMLKDSNALLIIDQKFFEGPFHHSSFMNTPNQSNQLAYILYTSGSTGRPKGVAVEHRQLVNLIYHMFNRYDGKVDCDDRCLSLTNIMFDVSVWEFFLPLTFGARLVFLTGRKQFDVSALVEGILREEITLIYLPPGLLKEVNEQLKKQPGQVRLNKMLVGVEPIRDEVLESYLQLNPRMRIINGYGPTETTICATSVNYTSHKPKGEKKGQSNEFSINGKKN